MTRDYNMTSYKSSAELKNMAREQLSGKYGSAITLFLTQYLLDICVSFVMTFLVSAASTIFSFATNSEYFNAFSTVSNFIATFLSSVIVGILNTGNALFFLNIACKKAYSVSDLFYGFRNAFPASLQLSAISAFVNMICLLPYTICSTLYFADRTTSHAVMMIIALLAGYAVLLPISLSLSQIYFLLLDFPQYSVKSIVHTSIRLMKGHKRRLFYIQLSFLPLLLLGVLSFGIGNLWVTPYMNLTLTYFFLDIMQPSTRKE